MSGSDFLVERYLYHRNHEKNVSNNILANNTYEKKL